MSPPQSLAQCVVSGKLSVVHFLQLRAASSLRCTRRNLHKRLLRRHLSNFDEDDDDRNPNADDASKNGPQHWAKRCVWGRSDETGKKVPLKPQESMWYMMYVSNPLITDDISMHAKFRKRFCIPYANYLELVDHCTSDYWFQKWCGFKKNNKKASPIVRYLGRGFTFDDIEECTAISSEVHRVFFHTFVNFGRNVLYPKYVSFPKTANEATTHMAEFIVSGFPGCVGSSDCTHIATERCEYSLRNQHIGAKSSHPTRTFSLTANHRCRILHTSSGGPGSWNDQTMVRQDDFLSGIYHGLYLDDVQFELRDYTKSGTIINKKYRGKYVIVDNGYLRWSITVPPFKVTNLIDEIRWSKWVESMRKDVECTFGILKGRFRILKMGIRMDGINVVDNVWFTCCALHNWLLDIDGLTGEWVNGVPVSDWEGTMGEHDDDYPLNKNVPNAVSRLHHNLNFRHYDLSGMGPGTDEMNSFQQSFLSDDDDNPFDSDSDEDVNNEEGGVYVTVVCNMSLKLFRRKLVTHFGIMFQQNKLHWTIR